MKTVEKIRNLCPAVLTSHWLFKLAIVCIIVLASLKNSPSLGPITSYDKFNHLAAFFVLSFVFELSHPHLKPLFKVLLLIAFGTFIELLQAFIPWRSAELLDVVADGIGISIFYLSCFFMDFIVKFFVTSKG